MKSVPDDPALVRRLEQMAAKVRCHILRTVYHVGKGHVGGSMSAADLMTVLYFHALRIDPARPGWENRDRFILSKGHAGLALYCVMAERGFFPAEELSTFSQLNSRLQGHPDMTLLPGLDVSAGSLGQGLSVGIGMALGARRLGKDFHTYVLLGDGECHEGQVWEAAFVAARYELGNLTALVDRNRLSQYCWRTVGEGEPICRPPDENPVPKWEAFGWNTVQIDGHNIVGILDALEEVRLVKDKPGIVIANTIKGKGVSFMESKPEWHSSGLTDEQVALGLSELECACGGEHGQQGNHHRSDTSVAVGSLFQGSSNAKSNGCARCLRQCPFGIGRQQQ